MSNDDKSLAHTRWNCKYHIVFTPKYRRKVIYESSPQSCVKVQPHQKHNVLRCEPNCHAFLSEERGQEQ